VYAVITEVLKKWTILIHNWRQAMVRFIIKFGERFEKYIK
jgi:putative transposase